MPGDELKPDTERFEPPPDPVFQYLLEQAWRGSVIVYWAEVPLNSVQRFDPLWKPERLPGGAPAMQAVMRAIGEGHVPRPWVYPRGDRFIMSDDYFTLACFEMLKVETVRVWHLGVPPDGLPSHGPLAIEIIRGAIEGSPVTVRT